MNEDQDLSACSITPSLADAKQAGSPASVVDTGRASHTPDRPATSPDVCKFCGGPIDVECPMPIGGARFATGDKCRACVRDEMFDYSGVDR